MLVNLIKYAPDDGGGNGGSDLTIDDIAYPSEATVMDALGVDDSADDTDNSADTDIDLGDTGLDDISPDVDESDSKDIDVPDEEEEDSQDAEEDETPDPNTDNSEAEENKNEAHDKLTDLLRKSGYEDADNPIEQLLSDLNKGKKLQDLVGDTNLTDVLEKAKTLDSYEKIWAEQKENEWRENATSEEIIEKLEADLQAEKTRSAEALKAQESEAQNSRILNNFNNTASKIVDSSLKGESAELAKLLLGVNNPIVDIDISDLTAVKSISQDLVNKVNTSLEGIKKAAIEQALKDATPKIKQAAIDEYAKGKSKIVPNKKSDSQGKATTVNDTEFTLSKDVNSTDDAIDEMNDNLIEILTQSMAGMN